MRDTKDGNNTLTYVLPDVVDPPDVVCITLRIPNNKFHIMAFKGAIWDLCNWWNWEKDDAHTATQVAKVWRRVFRSMKFDSCNPQPATAGLSIEDAGMSDLIQVVCDSSGKCILQYRCDVCSPWQIVANITDLNTNPSGVGNQPAPGGGASSDCVTIFANSTYLIPIPVNTGDKIEITSATGKWSDQFARWLCIDGNLFFIDCTGVGGASGGAGDFLPSANHLSAIVQFSTGYFPLYPGGSLIVPSGISNEQPTILANKPAVNSGDGWIDICWKITNNQAATWSHTFDFIASPQGFTPLNTGTGDRALWQAGLGWTQGITLTSYIQLQKIFPGSATINKVEWVMNSGMTGTRQWHQFYVPDWAGSTFNINDPSPLADYVAAVPPQTTSSMGFGVDDGTSSAGIYIQKCVLSGTGTNPF